MTQIRTHVSISNILPDRSENNNETLQGYVRIKAKFSLKSFGHRGNNDIV